MSVGFGKTQTRLWFWSCNFQGYCNRNREISEKDGNNDGELFKAFSKIEKTEPLHLVNQQNKRKIVRGVKITKSIKLVQFQSSYDLSENPRNSHERTRTKFWISVCCGTHYSNKNGASSIRPKIGKANHCTVVRCKAAWKVQLLFNCLNPHCCLFATSSQNSDNYHKYSSLPQLLLLQEIIAF